MEYGEHEDEYVQLVHAARGHERNLALQNYQTKPSKQKEIVLSLIISTCSYVVPGGSENS